ncbi:MAG: TIR domain-containing protein [Anaerolineae bacterium]|nr:TIR domain-containing protein [Anaerolineae bacterium]
MRNYPFIHGRPLAPNELIGRQTHIKKILSRLLKRQSTAVVGAPHMGKTSLCNFISDEGQRRALLGEDTDRFIFSYIDAQILMGSGVTQADFWRYALQPLERYFSHTPLPQIAELYELAVQNGFGNFVLNSLFAELGQAELCYVIVVDEFDVLLHHPSLNSAEFFGGLRSLSSTTKGLVLITSSRRHVADMNRLTQVMNPHGSPFFNTFTEVKLGILGPRDIQSLFSQASDILTDTDRQFIQSMVGGHPFLLQMAAEAMCEAYEEDSTAHYQSAARNTYQNAVTHFEDTWRNWPSGPRHAFIFVSLLETVNLMQASLPNHEAVLQSLSNLNPQINELAEEGVLEREADNQIRVLQKIFSWWLTEQLIRHGQSLGKWIQQQELDGVIHSQEVEQLEQAISGAARLMPQAADNLIEMYIQHYQSPLLISLSEAPQQRAAAPRSLIFFSHSTQDDDFATRLAKDLRQATFETWVDHENIPAAAEWDVAIQNALNVCDVLILVITRKSTESRECSREWNYVLNRTPVIPVILEKGLELPYRLSLNQWVDFTSNYETALGQLLEALRQKVR